MTDGNLVRIGGLFGLLSVVLMIPAYLVGYPDAPGTSAEAGLYFDAGAEAFVFYNGVLPLFHVFFFIGFLGILVGLLRNAEGAEAGGGALSTAALVGGIVFIVLSAAGVTAEILYPATVMRFGDLDPEAPLALSSLALSAWLYHFCQVGAAVLVLATSLVALGTGVLPRWLALAGFVVALLALLHFVLPLLAAIVGLVWITAVSVVMLGMGGGRSGSRRPRRAAAR